MNSNVDLRGLAVQREAPGAPVLPSRRHLLIRLALPVLLLSGFAALLVYAVRESLLPPRAVTVAPVLSMLAGIEQHADTPLFRAAGWVEPRPTPTLVTALAEGVVEQLLVVEGHEVQPGEVIARLVAVDAELARDGAEADVKLRQGELNAARAQLDAARARLSQPVHLKVELADADVALAKTETELGNVSHLLRAGQARQEFARLDWENKEKLNSVVAQTAISKAKSELLAANAVVSELQARLQRLPVEVAALKRKREALLQKHELKIDEVRQVGEAEASVQIAEARLSQARIQRQAARLRLERMQVRSPAAGRVLSLIAKPGARLMGQDPRTLHDSSSVVMLYDPASLQVRVDVRLDDVRKVISGQKVKIETSALAETSLEGTVLTATAQADIQKNTLSVKVAVVNPPAILKPDMLCEVTFLAPPNFDRPAQQENRYRLFVPRQLVDGSDKSSRMWVANLRDGTAWQRTIQLGAIAGDLVEVVSGLSVSDRLIVQGREGLKDGDRIRIVGEDDTLGKATPVHKDL